jgi:hypothetical protein
MNNLERIENYIYEHLGTVLWSTVLLFGGSFFVLYYVHIEYMPVIDFSASIMLLAATAITGGLVILLFMMIAIVPGAVDLHLPLTQDLHYRMIQ